MVTSAGWCQETLAAHTQTTHTEHSSSRQTFQNLLITGESGDPVLILPLGVLLVSFPKIGYGISEIFKGVTGVPVFVSDDFVHIFGRK